MTTKLRRLLTYHRRHVFDDDHARADRHYRALCRLRRTRTFIEMCERNRQAEAHRASERLLRLYA